MSFLIYYILLIVLGDAPVSFDLLVNSRSISFELLRMALRYYFDERCLCVDDDFYFLVAVENLI